MIIDCVCDSAKHEQTMSVIVVYNHFNVDFLSNRKQMNVVWDKGITRPFFFFFFYCSPYISVY